MKPEVTVTSGKLASTLSKMSEERYSIVLIMFSGEGLKSPHCAAVDELTNGLLSRRVEHDGFDPRYKQSKVIDTDLSVQGLDKVILLGLGQRSKLTADGLREVLAEAFTAARDSAHAEHLIFPLIDVDLKSFSVEQFAQVVAEYCVLADYEPNHRKTGPWLDEAEQTHLKSLTLVANRNSLRQAKNGAALGVKLGEATCLARDLVNEPPSTMTAQHLAKAATKVATESDGLVSCKVFGKQDIKKMKMGGVLAVNRGSTKAPAFIELSYDPPSGATVQCLALVGKGVTFDTGGLDIKDYSSMNDMKMDMAGAAAVVAAMSLMSVLKPKISIRALVAATDNQISADAFLQGDVITMMSGKTVEVGHTDAEGRLTLADALHYAQEHCEATMIVDLATLTGAIEEALGVYVTGIFGNNDCLTRQVAKAAARAGEAVHELPMPDIYRAENKGKMADLTNDGGGPGSITAAWFLREFIKDGIEWVHADIAGTAFRTPGTAYGIEPAGGTGVGVRTLAHLIASFG